MTEKSSSTLRELERVNPSAASYSGGTSNQALAVIGAVCFGVVALIYILWMVAEIKEIPYHIKEYYYSLSDCLSFILWAVYYFLSAIGMITIGIALFVRNAPLLVMIGAGLSAFAELFAVFINTYYYIKNPSPNNVIWIVLMLLFTAAWALVLLSVISKEKRTSFTLGIVAIAAFALGFVFDLVANIKSYNQEYNTEPFLSIYWKVTLCDIATVVGVAIVLFIVLAKVVEKKPELLSGGNATRFAVNNSVMSDLPAKDNVTIIYCDKCGTKLKSDVKYCYNCGAPVQIPDAR